MTRPYLSLILPAYNEASAINNTLSAMRPFLDSQGYSYEVIVASDGDDETPDIVRGIAGTWPELKLEARRGRHGKGHGIRRGVALANGEVVGFLDADYKTPVDEIERVLPLLAHGYDIVVGSRGVAESRVQVPARLYRRIGSRFFAFGLRALIGLHEIRDTQCGFKFFTAQAAREIFSQTVIDGYMCDIEVLWPAKRFGYRVKELGVLWRDDADSRLDLVAGNLQNCLELLRIRFERYSQPTPGIIAQPVGLAENSDL